jgi:hypothetical protein
MYGQILDLLRHAESRSTRRAGFSDSKIPVFPGFKDSQDSTIPRIQRFPGFKDSQDSTIPGLGITGLGIAGLGIRD